MHFSISFTDPAKEDKILDCRHYDAIDVFDSRAITASENLIGYSSKLTWYLRIGKKTYMT